MTIPNIRKNKTDLGYNSLSKVGLINITVLSIMILKNSLPRAA